MGHTPNGEMVGPGTELHGFVIEAIAGRGGMGIVYRAHQRQPARTVALKVIAGELAGDPAFKQRFQREAAIAAEIEHPNVIPVYAVGDADGVLYIAMRYIDGIDLRALLADEQRLEPRRAASIVDQVADALDVAHARGLVHRDVKPANILITHARGRDHVYLSDFGLSRHVHGSRGMTDTGAVLGTIDYIAPEQARGERVDARTDVYSLGCVLFQVLTGTVPYPLDNDVAKLYAHDSQPPPSVCERAPDVPPTFELVLGRAMAKRPDDRYQSAGDLGRAALAAASGGEPLERERSVAIGDAAPSTARGRTPSASEETSAPRAAPPPGQPSTALAAQAEPKPGATPQPRLRPTRRLLMLVACALAGAVVAALVVVLVSGGGKPGLRSPTVSGAAPAGADVQRIPNSVTVQVKETRTPKGFGYRLELVTVRLPPSTPASSPAPYYFVLSVRHGRSAYAVVERKQLPYKFTASSVVAQFQLDPNHDETANVGLSWYVQNGDTNDVTHYFTLTPTGINVN